MNAEKKKVLPKPMAPPPPPTKELIRDDVAKNRHCPICWERRGGKGVSDGRIGRTRYYVCDTCSHSWKKVLTIEEMQND